MNAVGPLAYGIAHWHGPLVLERESQQAGRPSLVALGHGLRLTEAPWIEVAVHQPGSRLAASHPAILVTAVTHRLDQEAAERRARGMPSRPDGSWEPSAQTFTVDVDGEPMPLPALYGGELRSGALRLGDAVLMITSYRYPDWDGMSLVHVSDLTPYVLGALKDVHRRQSLPPLWTDPPPE